MKNIDALKRKSSRLLQRWGIRYIQYNPARAGLGTSPSSLPSVDALQGKGLDSSMNNVNTRKTKRYCFRFTVLDQCLLLIWVSPDLIFLTSAPGFHLKGP